MADGTENVGPDKTHPILGQKTCKLAWLNSAFVNYVSQCRRNSFFRDCYKIFVIYFVFYGFNYLSDIVFPWLPIPRRNRYHFMSINHFTSRVPLMSPFCAFIRNKKEKHSYIRFWGTNFLAYFFAVGWLTIKKLRRLTQPIWCGIVCFKCFLLTLFLLCFLLHSS